MKYMLQIRTLDIKGSDHFSNHTGDVKPALFVLPEQISQRFDGHKEKYEVCLSIRITKLHPISESATAAYAVEHLKRIVPIDQVVCLLKVENHGIDFHFASSSC
ncbi:uncharacterized protein PHALS_10411 [Plasmopara halstedii]|uniref:Uncharacterized protein n=1 Tax=Plasmopara halstedii TaxID=4781 RepID=A0A0P1AHG7_PLAHL|nr:uncharacterized protein PHALS_10411 [Plasmopara halstedii]CEG40199.1 hypothetical protein PHALS_10411 [Plasmopara halstedii]|eukprot:XP_024576568.1 hypothetical protein PHALS_10411 [Plasmopara halstedii]